MPDPCTYDYAIVRVVPRVERGEFVNVGVILSCKSRDFLRSRIEMDERRVLALDPESDLQTIRATLETIPIICEGGPAAGALGHRATVTFDLLGVPGTTSVRLFLDMGGHWGGDVDRSQAELAGWTLVPLFLASGVAIVLVGRRGRRHSPPPQDPMG